MAQAVRDAQGKLNVTPSGRTTSAAPENATRRDSYGSITGPAPVMRVVEQHKEFIRESIRRLLASRAPQL